jgi:hypothetical protein
MMRIIIFILSALVFTACNKSKLTEADLPSNQKLLSVCVTPWGQTVLEGAKAVAYENDKAACKDDCVSLEYLCTNGQLTAVKKDGADITNDADRVDIENAKQSCQKEQFCSCELPNGKGVVSHGVKIQAYSSGQVACGETCTAKEIDVLCQNGIFVDAVTTNPVAAINFSCSALECKSCTAPWDAMLKVAHGGMLTGYAASTLGCGLSCAAATNSVSFTCNNGSLTKGTTSVTVADTALKSSCQVSTSCSCTTADPQTYSHDSTTVYKLFQKQTGSCSSPCDAGVDYKCLDGNFSKVTDGTKPTTPVYKACVDQCIYCDLPDGTKIKQGTTATLFKDAVGTCDLSCQKLIVRCDVNTATKTGFLTVTNGATGAISDYKVAACSETCVTCNLPDGTKLQESKTATLFTSTSVGCNQNCNSGTVTCDKATASLKLVSGTGVVTDYKYASCVGNCVQCTLPDGTKLNEGQIAHDKFAAPTVKCGESCSKASLWCLGGKLIFFGTPTGAASAIESYRYSSCSAEPCKECSLPWSTTAKLNNNAEAVRYTTASVSCGESCESKKVTLKCSDSVLQVIAGDATANLTTSVDTCSAQTCQQCTFAGKQYTEGQRVTAYKNNGSSCAVGVCADYISLTCKSGAWTGGDAAVYKYDLCQNSCVPAPTTEVGRVGDTSAESGGANPWLCPVLHSRGFAWGGTKLTYYTKASVPAGDSCNRYKVIVECNNLSGLFSNSNRMLYLQCKEN